MTGSFKASQHQAMSPVRVLSHVHEGLIGHSECNGNGVHYELDSSSQFPVEATLFLTSGKLDLSSPPGM